MQEKNERRVRKIVIRHEFWRMLLVDGGEHSYRIADGIPKDAEVIFQEWRPEYDGFAIFVRHGSYDEVPEGEEVPAQFVGFEWWNPSEKTAHPDDVAAILRGD